MIPTETIATHSNYVATGPEIRAAEEEARLRHLSSSSDSSLCSGLLPAGGFITAMDLSPDGRYLVAGGADGHISAWDLLALRRGGNRDIGTSRATPAADPATLVQPRLHFRAHMGPIADLKFTGGVLVTLSKGQLRAWRWETLVVVLFSPEAVNSASVQAYRVVDLLPQSTVGLAVCLEISPRRATQVFVGLMHKDRQPSVSSPSPDIASIDLRQSSMNPSWASVPNELHSSGVGPGGNVTALAALKPTQGAEHTGHLLSASGTDGRIRLWDGGNGNLLLSVAPWQDHAHALLYPSIRTLFEHVRTTARKMIANLQQQPRDSVPAIDCLSVTEDGRYVLAGGTMPLVALDLAAISAGRAQGHSFHDSCAGAVAMAFETPSSSHASAMPTEEESIAGGPRSAVVDGASVFVLTSEGRFCRFRHTPAPAQALGACPLPDLGVATGGMLALRNPETGKSLGLFAIGGQRSEILLITAGGLESTALPFAPGTETHILRSDVDPDGDPRPGSLVRKKSKTSLDNIPAETTANSNSSTEAVRLL
eukprot:Clim_evm23s242 gene=Clim_evmTU23s242